MGFICMPCRQKQCNTDSNYFVHGCILEDVDDVGTMRCYSMAVYVMSYGWIVHLHDKCDRIGLDTRIWKNTEKCIGI